MVRVPDGDGPDGQPRGLELLASVPLLDAQGAAKGAAALRAELTAAAKAAYVAEMAARCPVSPSAIAWTGTVDLG